MPAEVWEKPAGPRGVHTLIRHRPSLGEMDEEAQDHGGGLASVSLSELETLSTTLDLGKTTSSPARRESLLQSMKASLRRSRHSFKALGELLAKAPWVIVIPAFVFMALTLAGELGVTYAAEDNKAQRRHLAESTVDSMASSVALQLQRLSAPTVAVAASVRALPFVPDLAPQFPDIAAAVLAKLDSTNSVQRCMILPWGIVAGVYPTSPSNNLDTLDHSFFADPARAAGTIQTVQNGADYMDIMGPVTTLDGTQGFLSRIVLFLPSDDVNETWGMDTEFTVPYALNLSMGRAPRPSLGPCGSRCAPIVTGGGGPPLVFWGMVRTVVRSKTLITLLSSLEQQREPYRYRLYREEDALLNDPVLRASPVYNSGAGATILASSSSLGPPVTAADAPACSLVEAGAGVNVTWGLCIAPQSGWVPAWEVPLLIMVPFLSLLVAGLLFGIMLGRRQYQQLVLCMLPAKAISKLRDGSDYVEPFKNVTVLFSDIVSYTHLSSELPPCQVVKLLRSMFQHFDGLVDKHSVHKVETIGDAFFAICGAPEPCHPRDAAIRMARMALDMVDFTRDFEHDGRKVEIRVGMYTGDVTAAVIGSKMPHWTILGDTVNVASRMESHSVPLRVQVGHTTARLLSGLPEFELQPRGLIKIKGKGMMPTYFLSRGGEGPVPERVLRLDTTRSYRLLTTTSANTGSGGARADASSGATPRISPLAEDEGEEARPTERVDKAVRGVQGEEGAAAGQPHGEVRPAEQGS